MGLCTRRCHCQTYAEQIDKGRLILMSEGMIRQQINGDLRASILPNFRSLAHPPYAPNDVCSCSIVQRSLAHLSLEHGEWPAERMSESMKW